jgi:single stranded DNA-binding protein
MPSLNRVQMIGRLGKDPESRLTPTGKKATHFNLAVSQRWKSLEGENKESTEWVNNVGNKNQKAHRVFTERLLLSYEMNHKLERM